MKTLLIFILLIPVLSFAQNEIQIQSVIDSLLKCNSNLNFEITTNNKKIDELREKSALIILNKQKVNSLSLVLKSPVRILNEEFVLADTIAVAKAGDSIQIIGYSTDYFIAKYKNKTGFIHYYSIQMNDELMRFKELSLKNMLDNEKDENKKNAIQRSINVFNNQKTEDAEALKLKESEAAEALKLQKSVDELKLIFAEKEKQRKKEMLKKYGQTIGQKIIDGKIWIGMTSAMARDSWGNPEKNNRTVNRYTVREQWVYSDSYLYFEDGILTSWQD